MIFFHTHKSCFQICFGITVSVFSHDLKAFFIFHQSFSALFQFLMQLLKCRLSFPFSVNEFDSLVVCDHREIVLEFPYFEWRTVINLYNTVIGEFFMFCKLSFSVLFDHFPDLVHSFNHKHLCISQSILYPIIILLQKSIIFSKKLVDRIQEACKMVINASAPYKSITVRICLYLCTVNKKFF